jgi:hypothetical protein
MTPGPIDHRAEALRVLATAWDDDTWGEASEALMVALAHGVLDLADAVRELRTERPEA